VVPLKRLTTKAWMLALISVVAATLTAESLYQAGWAMGAEHLYSDLWHRLAGKRHVPEHVAVVMVDDPSLAAHPDDPLVFWTPYFARAIATLKAAGVKTVALDYSFSVSPERWIEQLDLPHRNNPLRDYDRPFRQQLNSDDVLMASFRTGDGKQVEDFLLPSPDYLLALPDYDIPGHLGLANLRTDPDGTVRRFGPTEADAVIARREGFPALSFGMLAAIRFSGQDPHAATWQFGNRRLTPDDDLKIAYGGPPGTVTKISFERLLASDALADPAIKALAGKVVIVGAGFSGNNDVHSTPYSTNIAGAQDLMPGPEIQANLVETLLAGRFVDDVPAPWRAFAFVASFALLAFLGVRLSPWQAIALMAVIAALSAFTGHVLFGHDLLFPVAHLQIGLAVVLTGLAALRLSREQRERARIGKMFGRYVSDQVMTALLASPELPELGGQATTVTVLFSDIRNFTTLSERLSAREVVEMLNTYFERACDVLLKEGATIDKFIGDAIMAEFGAPLPQPDHALRALRAAVALHAVAVDFRAWMSARFVGRSLPEFDVGVGIHSGEAVIGNIGSSSRMEYTAIGDTVNLASRLEGKTKETHCAILASIDTVSAVGAAVRTGSRHILTVKGRSEPVEAFEILAVTP
jgi:class 3 adenylate cyclase/CHASE2 domain-containing sensor protein